MITGPDAQAIEEIVLLTARRRLSDNTLRPVFTEIDKVFLRCHACTRGPCEIAYWTRGEANRSECQPQILCCKQCPQWNCPPCANCVTPSFPLLKNPI